MHKIPVGVLGASGYAGRELCALVQRHPRFELVFATANGRRGETAELPGGGSVTFVAPDDVPLGSAALVFSALPHGTSAEWVQRVREGGARAVDLSADLRIGNTDADIVYGLTEARRDLHSTWFVLCGTPTVRTILAGLLARSAAIAGAGAAVPGVCEQAAVSDPVVLLLLANLLLRRGEAGRVLELLGLEPARFRPVRRRDKPPALLDELAGQGVPLWPAALAPQVHTSLACHALLAAAAAGAGWPWEDWLRQSYGWPKDVLVWWTLGTLKEDPALLRNIAGADQVFFAARPV